MAQDSRQELEKRLADALRRNLARRKQARRDGADADSQPAQVEGNDSDREG